MMDEKRDKQFYEQRASDEMARHFISADYDLRQKLALAGRMLAREEHESGLAGQITARGERPGTFWTARFGYGLDEVTAGNLLLVDDDLHPVEGDGMPNPSTRFHLWVYRARPDVSCILHTHPPHVSALSMLGEELAVAHMDTTMFFEDCAYLPDWPGVPFGDEEGEIISRALGQKHAILLGHHGQLVACATIEEAAVLAVFIERAAKMQLRARAVGPVKPIRPELAREARQYRLKSKAIEATFNYFARQILRDQGDGAIR
jgi:L-fuculose-phosphate aldolase